MRNRVIFGPFWMFLHFFCFLPFYIQTIKASFQWRMNSFLLRFCILLPSNRGLGEKRLCNRFLLSAGRRFHPPPPPPPPPGSVGSSGAPVCPPRRAHPPPSLVVLDENHIRTRVAAPERRVYELRGGVSGFPLDSSGFLKFAARRENTEVKPRFITLSYFLQSRASQTSVWVVWRRLRAKARCFNLPAGRASPDRLWRTQMSGLPPPRRRKHTSTVWC